MAVWEIALCVIAAALAVATVQSLVRDVGRIRARRRARQALCGDCGHKQSAHRGASERCPGGDPGDTFVPIRVADGSGRR